MATAGAVIPKTKGGAFLVEESTPDRIFTIEDLSDELPAMKLLGSIGIGYDAENRQVATGDTTVHVLR